jgi:hypothetical protein
MSAEPLVLASALYWGVYVIAIAVAVPCALALLFGVMQTAKWLLRGGKTASGNVKVGARIDRGDALSPSEGPAATPAMSQAGSPSRRQQG